MFYRKTFWVPQQRPIHELFETPDAIVDDVADLLSAGKTIAEQEFVDFTQHSQYPNPPPCGGFPPSGKDRIVVLAWYKALPDRAKELSTTYANYRSGPGRLRLPVHNIVFPGTTGIGELPRLNRARLVTKISVHFTLQLETAAEWWRRSLCLASNMYAVIF